MQQKTTTTGKFPPFLIVLFFVTMWERFSYYGMRAILVLFLTSQLGFADAKAYAVYSVFAALSYAGPMLGGILADKLMGFRSTILLGGIIIILGHLAMTLIPLKSDLTFLGLALIAIGTGFFKGNITSLLGSCYDDHDANKDKGFTLFHVGINLGSFVASIACGYVAAIYGWHYAFGLAGIGMFAGLIIFIKYQDVFGNNGLAPNLDSKKGVFLGIKPFYSVFFLSIIFSFMLKSMLESSDVFAGVIYYFGGLMLLILGYVTYKADSHDRKNIITLVILIIFLMFFLALEMQLGSLINLFVERNVVQEVFGITIPAAVSQGINPLAIIVFGFYFSAFVKFKLKYSLLRFAFGLLTTAICFFILYIGCLFANSGGRIDYIYLFIAISFIGLGELLIIPFIHSQVTTLAPKNLQGFMMGILMLSLSFSNLAGFIIAKFMSVPSIDGKVDSLVSLAVYREGFLDITKFNVLLFIIFLFFIPMIGKQLRKNQ